MKTILVPTDFSKNAGKALRYAVMLAKKEKAAIVLFHSFHLVYSTPDLPGRMIVKEAEKAEKKMNQRLQAMCNKIKKSDRIKCIYVNKPGLAVDEILEKAKEIRPDFIVMGTKGASGIKEALIGSNTAKIVSSAASPVIAVPENISVRPVRKIVYASDYLFSDIVTIKKVVEIARLFKATVTVIHILEGEYHEYEEEEMMKRFMKKIAAKIAYKNIRFHLVSNSGKSIEEGLDNYLRNKPVSLVAMSTLQKNLLEKMVSKSITKKMVCHTHIPLLVFHHKKHPVLFI